MTERRERRAGSDLAPRIVIAIPAIVFALIIVHEGGEVFAAGILVLGVVAMGELYTLMGRVRPPALAGFLTLAAMLIAALYGEPRHVIMVLAASFPVTFFIATLRPRREHVRIPRPSGQRSAPVEPRRTAPGAGRRLSRDS